MRARRRTMSQLRDRLGYFWDDLDPAGVELLSAALSLTVGLTAFYRGDNTTTIAYAQAYGVWCIVAALTKFVGTLWEWRALRLFGLYAGAIFWVTLSFVLGYGGRNSITWLAFAMLALAQLWAARRVWHG